MQAFGRSILAAAVVATSGLAGASASKAAEQSNYEITAIPRSAPLGLSGDENYDARSVTVTLSSLDLASPRGRIGVHHRIMVAALRACDRSDGVQTLAVAADSARCRDEAFGTAWGKVQTLLASAKTNQQFAAVMTIVVR